MALLQKPGGGGEISLTLSEGQPERGGQVRGKSACPLRVSAQPARGHTQRASETKVAFTRLSCQTTDTFQLLGISTCSEVSLWGLVCFRFDRRDVDTRNASAVTCATTNRAAVRGIVGNVVSDQTTAGGLVLFFFFQAMTRCFWAPKKEF